MRTGKHPVLVAHDSGLLVGWGAISSFKARSAYQNTGEVTIYVDHRFVRRGIGSAILKALMAHAMKSGLHTLIAMISADQAPSIILHEKLGFSTMGRLAQVGRKFDRWLDVVTMQCMVRTTQPGGGD